MYVIQPILYNVASYIMCLHSNLNYICTSIDSQFTRILIATALLYLTTYNPH